MEMKSGETVVLLKGQGEVKAGTLGRIDGKFFDGIQSRPTSYRVLFGKNGADYVSGENLARVVNRRFPVKNLAVGARFVFDKCNVDSVHAGIVYTVRSRDDGFLSAYAHCGTVRNFRVIGDAMVILLDRVEEKKVIKNDPEKYVSLADAKTKNDELEICNKLFFAVCNEKTEPCGVLSFVTIHDKKTGAVRHQLGCSFCNLDSGDKFDFEEGCRIAMARAISGEKVKHPMLECENYKTIVSKIYHFLRCGV